MTQGISQITLSAEHTQWAFDTAKASAKRWSTSEGYYTNQFSSHFKGKLGELAVEQFLFEQGFNIDTHFRFAERENLCDIVVKIKRYEKVCRLEVKTWDKKFWAELGRCIAVEQTPDLNKKADVVIWCTVAIPNLKAPPASAMVDLAGWSYVSEIVKAPVKFTGGEKMRKIQNHQLMENELHGMHELPTIIQ